MSIAACTGEPPESATLVIDDETPQIRDDAHEPSPGPSSEEGLERRRAFHRRIQEHQRRCPQIWFPLRGPFVQAGPTMDAIASHLCPQGSRCGFSDVGDAVHPVSLPGVRFVVALDYSGACMMAWSSRACFVSERGVFCSVDGDLEAFVRAHGLDEAPERLSDEQWHSLVATFSGAREMLPTGGPVDACSAHLPEDLLAPLREALPEVPSGVVRTVGGVSVWVTVANSRDGTIDTHELHIEPRSGAGSPRVEVRRTVVYRWPADLTN